MPGKTRDFTELNAVDVDPDLMRIAVEDVADGTKAGNPEPDLLVTCASAYVEYIGIEAEPGEDALTEDDLLVIQALVCRMLALVGVVEQGHLSDRMASDDDDGRLAAIEAACTTRLIDRGGRPAFQLLDYLAHLSQADRR